MADTLRLFIAIELPQELLHRIGEAIEALRGQEPRGLRWARPEGIHLTLKFLGNVPEGQVPAILSTMKEAAAGVPPFQLLVHGAGAFPSMRSPRVFWLGVQGHTELLLDIQRRLEEALEALGFAREERPFSPHLTMARVNGRLPSSTLQNLGQAMERLRQMEPWPLPAKELSLMESRLARGGTLYLRKAQGPLVGE